MNVLNSSGVLRNLYVSGSSTSIVHDADKVQITINAVISTAFMLHRAEVIGWLLDKQDTLTNGGGMV